MQAVSKISSVDYSRSLHSCPEPTTWSLTAVDYDSTKPVMALGSLPDDILLQIIAACGEGVGLPELEAVSALSCLCSDLLRQLYQLQPLVSVQVRTIAQRFNQGPWRIKLLYTGEPTVAVLQQATRGHVHSIDARRTVLTPAVAERVVPELLGAGCSLLQLKLEGVKLNGSWAATFGEAAVCSTALRTLRLNGCRLRGPLPELRQLPALEELCLSNNQLGGGLEPLRGCKALLILQLSNNFLTGGLKPLENCLGLAKLSLDDNQLTGDLEPLRACASLQLMHLGRNQLVPTDKDRDHFDKQRLAFARVVPPRGFGGFSLT